MCGVFPHKAGADYGILCISMSAMDTAVAKAAVLTEALPYIRDFHGSVVLVKLGGSVMETEANLDSLMDDIAFMRAVGMKVVIVHGGGKAISKALKESGHEPKFVDGLRVTDEVTMEVVRHTLNNVVNPDLVRRLQKRGANARPIHGNWVFGARKIETPDRGYVGEVVSADTRAVCEMLDAQVELVFADVDVADMVHLERIPLLEGGTVRCNEIPVAVVFRQRGRAAYPIPPAFGRDPLPSVDLDDLRLRQQPLGRLVYLLLCHSR